MSYIHKLNHKIVISNQEYDELPFSLQLFYRYTNQSAPNLGSSDSGQKLHIPITPSQDSYIEHWPIDPNSPKQID